MHQFAFNRDSLNMQHYDTKIILFFRIFPDRSINMTYVNHVQFIFNTGDDVLFLTLAKSEEQLIIASISAFIILT